MCVVCVCGWGVKKPVCPSKTLSVFTFKTFPCVPAASPHVSYMWAWCRYTRGRFESTHGKRFERVHGFFHVFFTVPQHTQTHTTTNNTTTTTTPPPQRHTPHNTTRRQKQRETEKERQEKTREEMKKKREEEERRRREKMKEKMNRDKQFFRECPPAPELFSRQIPENVWQRRNYLAQCPRCPPAPELIRTVSVWTPPN